MATPRELEQAEETGRAARRSNIPFARCPYRFGRTADDRLKADAWRTGWNAENEERRGQHAITPSAG